MHKKGKIDKRSFLKKHFWTWRKRLESCYAQAKNCRCLQSIQWRCCNSDNLLIKKLNEKTVCRLQNYPNYRKPTLRKNARHGICSNTRFGLPRLKPHHENVGQTTACDKGQNSGLQKNQPPRKMSDIKQNFFLKSVGNYCLNKICKHHTKNTEKYASTVAKPATVL